MGTFLGNIEVDKSLPLRKDFQARMLLQFLEIDEALVNDMIVEYTKFITVETHKMQAEYHTIEQYLEFRCLDVGSG